MNMVDLEAANHLLDACRFFVLRFKMYAAKKTQKKNTSDLFAELQENAETLDKLITAHKGVQDANDSEEH